MNGLFARMRILALSLAMLGAAATPALAWNYQVQWGDSLYKLAREYGTTVDRLRAANGAWSDLILAGATIEIPERSEGASSYTQDMDLLARLIHAEAGGESFIGQVAVGAVVMNRMNDGRFAPTVAENIFRPDEFESVTNGYFWSQPSAENYRAAALAVAGWDPTGGAEYFFNPAKTNSAWIWSRPITARIGNHVFSR